MHADHGLAIARPAIAHELLDARRSDARQITLGPKILSRNQLKLRRIRRLPFESQPSLAGVIEVFDQQ